MAQCCNQGGADVPVSSRDGTDANTGTSSFTHSTADLSRSKCYGATPVATAFQGQPAALTLWVMDRNGAPVNLDQASVATVLFVVKNITRQRIPNIEAEATITDAVNGKVSVELEESDTRKAGIYLAQVIVKDADDVTLWVTPYWFVIDGSLDLRSVGPITMAEVRLSLRDSCPAQNLLLQDFEFDDTQLVACMRMPVDEFNEKWQPKTRYTPSNFPYRFHWLRATCGYLLNTAAIGYARDHLPYAAGGVSVDDKNKAGSYSSLSTQLLTEWRQFIRDTKLEMNVAASYGHMASGYSASGW
jgi:uncharacterized lipoprotein NlpE involved in copper resistance